MRKLLPLLLAVSGLLACDGGCGEDPNAASKKTAPPAQSGGGSSSKSSGSGDVNLADFDGRGQSRPAAAQPAPQHPAQATPPATSAKTPPLEEVTKADWAPRVLRATTPVLVIVTGRSCPDCDLIAPVARSLAVDFPTWKFLRLDAADKDSKGLLPKGMAPVPLPAFLIYEQGWAHSRKQGLPFARGKKELDVDYQTRLARWFKDALTQKNFSFATKK